MLILSPSLYQPPVCRSHYISDDLYSHTLPKNGLNVYSWLHRLNDYYNTKAIVPSPISKESHNITSDRISRHSLVPSLSTEKGTKGCNEPSTNSHHTVFHDSKSHMNGLGDSRMTGSANPRTENLNWLSEVSTGGVRSGQNLDSSSVNHDKRNGSIPSILHNSEELNTRNSLNTIILGTSPGNTRMYATSYQAERFHLPHHQTSGRSGSGLSLYYSQAPRTTPYSSFYHTQMPYSCLADSSSSTQSRLSTPYFQTETYAPTVSSIANVPLSSAHPAYLHSASSPVALSVSPSSVHTRLPLPSVNVLLNRSPEEAFNQDHIKGHIPIPLSQRATQFHQDDRRKIYKSSEPTVCSNSQSPSHDIQTRTHVTDLTAPKETAVQQSISPSHLTYKVPTGKEGSLKHRILRPPSINIVEPPSSAHDAPLSAPPIRSHREPSPKQMRYEPYRSFSTSTSFGLDVSLAQPQSQTRSPSFAPQCSSPPMASSSESSVPPSDGGTQLKYPPAFMKGSIIQLANSQLKPVEHMTTEDFLECEALSSNLKVDSSTVVSIEKMPASGAAKLGFSVGQKKLQITVEAPLEHPFFVYKQGWSSCSPERSLLRYGLCCHKLKVGDMCIFLTVKNESSTSPDKSSTSQSLNPPLLVPTTTLLPHEMKSATTKSLSVKSSRDEVQCLTSKPQSLLLATHSSQEKLSSKIELQKTQSSSTSISLPSTNASFDNKPSSNSPLVKKRKRRWSAPGEVSLEQSSAM